MNTDVLIDLTVCGLLGLVGQGIRVIIGLKKLQEEAESEAGSAPQTKMVYDQKFDARQLWLSLLIGFIAGCLANLVREEGEIGKEVQAAMIAAGYAGTDFIEGVLKKVLPK